MGYKEDMQGILKDGEEWALLKRELAYAEQNVKIVRSELIKEVSQFPEKYISKSKATATDIEVYYRLHKKHIAAKTKIIESMYKISCASINIRYKVALLDIAKDEIE